MRSSSRWIGQPKPDAVINRSLTVHVLAAISTPELVTEEQGSIILPIDEACWKTAVRGR
jgi:hypothetical protein